MMLKCMFLRWPVIALILGLTSLGAMFYIETHQMQQARLTSVGCNLFVVAFLIIWLLGAYVEKEG